MVIWLAMLAVLIVLVYLMTVGRRDDTWSISRLYKQRRPDKPRRDQGIDPTFRFDDPPTDTQGLST